MDVLAAAITGPTAERILNQRFGLRNCLENTKYHNYEGSIPKTDLVAAKEPALQRLLKEIAAEIAANPDMILRDTYTATERKKDWIALCKKPVLDESGDVLPVDARSRPGHKILDHHMPHFFDVKNHRGESVRSNMTTDVLEKALQSNIAMHTTPYKSEIRRMVTMTAGLANVTKYRTVTAKAVVEYFGARRILDPCVGWGGRMLGTLASEGGATYVGCEPDPNTLAGLRGILADASAIPAAVRSRAKILGKPVEDALREELVDEELFDLVLTSPPYFNLELYTAGPQSTERFSTWEIWVRNWLAPVIHGCLGKLREGGTSCWSVKNIKSDRKYPLADVVEQLHKEKGWELVKTVIMRGSARPGGNRIDAEGRETRESEEATFCFQHRDSAVST